MSDLQVVVKVFFVYKFFGFTLSISEDVSSLTDTLASIRHRSQFNVWIRTIFCYGLLKIQDEPTARCRGKQTDRESHIDSVHRRIRIGPFI